MFRRFLIFTITLLIPVLAQARAWSVSGSVTEKAAGQPVAGAIIKLGEDYLWTTSDTDGKFRFENVQPGAYILETSCLGYVTVTREINVNDDIEGINVILQENSLALDEVVVTAQKAKDGLSTRRSWSDP